MTTLHPTRDPMLDHPMLDHLATAEILFADGDTVLCGRTDRSCTSRPSTRSDDVAWTRAVLSDLVPGTRAVAALSFEADGPAIAHRLARYRTLPGGILRAGAVLASGLGPEEQGEQRHRVHAHPTPGEYADAVSSALGRISEGDLRKVVLGRSLHVLSDPPLRPAAVLARLAGFPGGTPAGRYLFQVPLGDTGRSGGPQLVGASPELLVRRAGTTIEAMPLAGSVPRHPDPVVDRTRRDALVASTKDLAEHDFVVDDLTARLRQVCSQVRAVARPEVVATDTMWHLATPISAILDPERLDDPACSALGLAQLVHPTPAVGGVPQAAAVRAIAEIEGEPRGWFGGCVGWVDHHGDGEFALTLRSGVLDGGSLRLWAGAGIVAGSVPADEVTETGAKLATMTRAVGL